MRSALVMVVTFAVCAMAAASTAAAKQAATTAAKAVEQKEAVTAPAKGTEQKPGAATVVKMKISADGSAIIDEQGNEIARFKEGMKVKAVAQGKSAVVDLPGCMCCKDECLVYDNKTAKCIKTYRSCTWDFDCNCTK